MAGKDDDGSRFEHFSTSGFDFFLAEYAQNNSLKRKKMKLLINDDMRAFIIYYHHNYYWKIFTTQNLRNYILVIQLFYFNRSISALG